MPPTNNKHDNLKLYIYLSHIIIFIILSALYYMTVFGDMEQHLNGPILTGHFFDSIYERKSHIDQFYGSYAVAEFNIHILGIICTGLIQLASAFAKYKPSLHTPPAQLVSRIAVSGFLVFLASSYGPIEPRHPDYHSPYSWIGSTFYGHTLLLACLLLLSSVFFRDICKLAIKLLCNTNPSTKD